MTAIGRSQKKIASLHLQFEIRSVNHKFCEIHSRIAPQYHIFEPQITQLIKKKVSRGKIDLWLGEDKSEGSFQVNRSALRDYHCFLEQVRKELKLKDPITLAHIQSGSQFWMTKEGNVKNMWAGLKKMVEEALNSFLKMRANEGANLKKDISRRLKTLENLYEEVGARRELVVQDYKAKLEKRIAKIVTDHQIDPARLASEVALLADRSDISEEIERLSSHFQQMAKLVEATSPCGRPLDFLIQEINREWNTIASKAQDGPIAHLVVTAKSELEKIREQIQNIE